jgi:fumarate hydratase class II
LEKLDEQINVRRQEFNTLVEEGKGLGRELSDATSTQTNQELTAMISKLTTDNATLLEKVE